MSMLKLFRKETLSDDKTSCSYILDKSSLGRCQDVSKMKGFLIKAIRVTIEGQEMQPDKKMKVSSWLEISDLAKKSMISSCLFKGIFDEMNIEIVVDFDNKKIKIISNDSKIIEKVKNKLEEM